MSISKSWKSTFFSITNLNWSYYSPFVPQMYIVPLFLVPGIEDEGVSYSIIKDEKSSTLFESWLKILNPYLDLEFKYACTLTRIENGSTYCCTIGNSIKYLVPLNPELTIYHFISGYLKARSFILLSILFSAPSKFLSVPFEHSPMTGIINDCSYCINGSKWWALSSSCCK